MISFVDPDNLIKENRLGMRVHDINEMVQKVDKFLGNKLTFSSKVINLDYSQDLLE